MCRAQRPAFLCILASALLLRPVAAEVIVVSVPLSDALAAAHDGDTLLLHAGNYADTNQFPAPVNNKSLVIAALGDGDVTTGPLMFNVGPGQRVVLRGLTIQAYNHQGAPALEVASGDVLVEDCTVLGRDGVPEAVWVSGGDAVRLSGGRLVLKDCVVEGGDGADGNEYLSPQAAGHGIHALSSLDESTSIAVYGGSVTGGRGGNGFMDAGLFTTSGVKGGHALFVQTIATLHLAGCTLQGGAGGDGPANPGIFTPDTYAGGDAVNIFFDSDLHLQDATLVGGVPGVDGAGTPGSPGDALDVAPAVSVTTYAGPHRSLSLGAPVPDGTVLTLDYAGVAGDIVGVFVSTSTAWLPLPGKQGQFHLGAPLAGPWILGPVDGTGALSLGTTPHLGLGPEDAVMLIAQGLVQPASGAMLLSSPTTTLLLASNF